MCGSAWADEVVLLPLGGVTTVATNSTDVVYNANSTSWTINQGSLTGTNIGKTPGPYCLVKFDASSISGNITSAILTFDYASSAYNTSYNVYLLGAADWNPTTVVWGDLSDNAKKVTSTIASGTWSTKNTAGTITYDIREGVSQSLMGMAICCNTARQQVISNIKLTINYTKQTLYTATFTESAGLTPSVTIYKDEDRTETIANGTLLDETTYYYTATLEGYKDVQGSFTVNKANPNISFAMIAKATFTYNVSAVDGEGRFLTELVSVTGYEGDSKSLAWSKYINVDGAWYMTSDNTFAVTASEAGEKTVVYEKSDIAYFFEMESLTRSGGVYLTEQSNSYSNGARLRLSKGSLYYTPALASGVYTLNIGCSNSNSSESEVYIYTRSSDGTLSDKLFTHKAPKGNSTINVEISVPEGCSIAFNGNEGSYNNNARMDYLVLTRVTADVVVTEAGKMESNGKFYATYSNADQALDFSAVDGLTAYYVTSASKKELSITPAETVPAGTAVLLEGAEAKTYQVPVCPSAAEATGNLLKVSDGTIVGNGTSIFVLGSTEKNGVGFYLKKKDSSIAAGKAYLEIEDDGTGETKSFISLGGDDATAISNVEAAQGTGIIYNLNGQRVAAPVKGGLYIVNGKKMLVK